MPVSPQRREYLRNFNREWIAKRRAEFMSDKSCVRCGSTTRLELDHIDRSQKVDHKIWSWSKERREAEIAKCQILCRECHWEKTKDELGYGDPAHGTNYRYNKYRCRCDECRAANTEKARRVRERKKAREASEEDS